MRKTTGLVDRTEAIGFSSKLFVEDGITYSRSGRSGMTRLHHPDRVSSSRIKAFAPSSSARSRARASSILAPIANDS